MKIVNIFTKQIFGNGAKTIRISSFLTNNVTQAVFIYNSNPTIKCLVAYL